MCVCVDAMYYEIHVTQSGNWAPHVTDAATNSDPVQVVRPRCYVFIIVIGISSRYFTVTIKWFNLHADDSRQLSEC